MLHVKRYTCCSNVWLMANLLIKQAVRLLEQFPKPLIKEGKTKQNTAIKLHTYTKLRR